MDLMPLDVIGDRLQDKVLLYISEYIKYGDINNLWNAFDAGIEEIDWDIYTALIEVSKQYEDGARKYAENNWKMGMPVHCFVDSAARHYMKFKRGDTDEPHDRAFLWNIVSGIWMHIYKPEYIDLPFAAKQEIKKEEKHETFCCWKTINVCQHRYSVECLHRRGIDIFAYELPTFCPNCGKKIVIQQQENEVKSNG